MRLDFRNGRLVKYANNRINYAESYAWYLNSKATALGEINSTRICDFPLKHTEYFISKNPPDNRQVAGVTMWPLAASGGWPLARGESVNAQRMRPYMPGAVGEGGLIRGRLLYYHLISLLLDVDTLH